MTYATTAHSDEHLALAVHDVMPLAARLRLMPRLAAEEWSVPVKSYSELDMHDGVAIVHKADLVEVVRQIGYTQSAVAILTTYLNPKRM